MVVYKLKCEVTGKSYIGKTRENLKKITQQQYTSLLSQEGRSMDMMNGGGGEDTREQTLLLSTLHNCVEKKVIAIRSRQS